MPECTNTGTAPTGLVVPGDAGRAHRHDTDLLQGLRSSRWNRLESGKFRQDQHSRRVGNVSTIRWSSSFSNSSAQSPPSAAARSGGTLFNTPFEDQGGTYSYPNPFTGILNPPRGRRSDWSTFRPMSALRSVPANMRSQYSAQYNLTIQRELTNDMKIQVGYVGSQGHRLLAYARHQLWESADLLGYRHLQQQSQQRVF